MNKNKIDIIDIKDKFLIDDDHSKIRGFLSAYDENGNRVFLKENMIVESGRNLILRSLKGSITIANLPFVKENNSNVLSNIKAFLSTQQSITTSNMDISSDLKPISFSIENSNEGEEPETITLFDVESLSERGAGESYESFPDNRNIVCLKITTLGAMETAADNTPLVGTRYASLGLVYHTDNSSKVINTTNDILFSRVTFPPYSQALKLNFYYYIYF